jgi:hypothetical protein
MELPTSQARSVSSCKGSEQQSCYMLTSHGVVSGGRGTGLAEISTPSLRKVGVAVAQTGPTRVLRDVTNT